MNAKMQIIDATWLLLKNGYEECEDDEQNRVYVRDAIEVRLRIALDGGIRIVILLPNGREITCFSLDGLNHYLLNDYLLNG
jgi:hypothetical protein